MFLRIGMVTSFVILFCATVAVSTPPQENSKVYDRLLQMVDSRCHIGKGTCKIIPVLEFPAYCSDLDLNINSSVILWRPVYEGAISINRKTGIAMIATLNTATKNDSDTIRTYSMHFYKLQDAVWRECQKPLIMVNGRCPK